MKLRSGIERRVSANLKPPGVALHNQARQLVLYDLEWHRREHREFKRELTTSGVKMATPHQNG